MRFRSQRIVVRWPNSSAGDKGTSPWLIALLVAALGASGPCTAAVTGFVIAKADENIKTRTAFLDRATDPQRSREDRKEVLRFLVATEENGPTKTWAQAELKTVEDELDGLKKSNETLQKQVDTSTRARLDAESRASVAEARASSAEKSLASKGHSGAEIVKLRAEARKSREDQMAALTDAHDAYTQLIKLKEQQNATVNAAVGTTLSAAPSLVFDAKSGLITSGASLGIFGSSSSLIGASAPTTADCNPFGEISSDLPGHLCTLPLIARSAFDGGTTLSWTEYGGYTCTCLKGVVLGR
jgi:hypothetical protein